MNTEEIPSRKEQNNFKKGNKRGCGCLPGCLSIIVILGLILLGIGYFVYRDVRSTTDTVYEDLSGQEQRRDQKVDINSGEPLSILLMGIDTGTEGRIEHGRSDTMMVMTLNPSTKESTIVSIPRDTYTEIAGRGQMDKINHAYAFGGTTMSVNTVQNLLDIPIDYYVSINMEGLEQIIDALGGVTVVPDRSFNQSGYSFIEGQPTELNGSGALAYSRMRKQDPEGDYGRQRRQREVVQAIMKETASVDSILNYRSVLTVIDNNMSTNMSFDEMVDMFGNYRSVVGSTHEDQLRGEGTRINGIYYDIVSDEELTRVQNLLKDELEINE